jgi:G patch domain-containing protein 1
MAYKRPRAAYEADSQVSSSPFVTYGTPLPPFDRESRDDGSYVPLWKQEVVDERGRKRLHGAFQGGFSAGYVYSRITTCPSPLSIEH